ncbi:MAG: hypothetical protein OEY79_01565 [Anaplasmataceae bacterium]|nr:hypothetical protein [Anaplasmataceae bacterium]
MNNGLPEPSIIEKIIQDISSKYENVVGVDGETAQSKCRNFLQKNSPQVL